MKSKCDGGLIIALAYPIGSSRDRVDIEVFFLSQIEVTKLLQPSYI